MCDIRENAETEKKGRRIAVVNHKCCQGRHRGYIESITGILRNRLGADVVFTEYSGHAAEIAGSSSGYELIIAVGGDGTISEIINGMDLKRQSLAVMPIGAGNSLARDLRIASVEAAADIIEKNRLSRIDLMCCEFRIRNEKFKRYAATTSGMGFFADVVSLANRYLKSTGWLCYSISSCLKVSGHEVVSARVRIDNLPSRDVRFTVFIVNNTAHMGNLLVFPAADIRDSALDIFLARVNGLMQLAANIGMVTRTYFCRPGTIQKVNRLNTVLEKPSLFMLDGEIFGPVDEVTYSVAPRRLQLLS